MPELPEVETTKLFLENHIINHKITNVIVRRKNLRWPIPINLTKLLKGNKFSHIERRGKYLIIYSKHGGLIIHLGMSGSISMKQNPSTPIKHDHMDICFYNEKIMRYNDPRRFGAILWSKSPHSHPLIRNIGVEPLSKQFSSKYLYGKLSKSKSKIKIAIMNSSIVAGVGNIYACEALFSSCINPNRQSNDLNKNEISVLVKSIKSILAKAIKSGGTSIKDFKVDDKAGYFQQKLQVYGKKDQSCLKCKHKIQSCIIGQRTTFFCPECQI